MGPYDPDATPVSVQQASHADPSEDDPGRRRTPRSLFESSRNRKLSTDDGGRRDVNGSNSYTTPTKNDSATSNRDPVISTSIAEGDANRRNARAADVPEDVSYGDEDYSRRKNRVVSSRNDSSVSSGSTPPHVSSGARTSKGTVSSVKRSPDQLKSPQIGPVYINELKSQLKAKADDI